MHTLQFLKNNTEAIAWLLIGIGLVIVATFCGLIYANNLGWGQDVFNIERTGQAGSFVGGTAGALWALAGVLFFKSALMLQRESLNKQVESLNVQREELKFQREELRLQRVEMSSTRAIFEQQSFETTFFNLLRNLKEIKDEGVTKDIQNIIREIDKSIIFFGKDNIEKATSKATRDNNDNVYINTIVCILELIGTLEKRKIKYTSILNSVFTTNEKIYILYISYIRDDLYSTLTNSEIKFTFGKSVFTHNLYDTLYKNIKTYPLIHNPTQHA